MKPQHTRYNCALDSVMAVIEGRWKCTILCMLKSNGSMRFSELQKMIGEITSRILSKQLRELEADGMVSRSVSAEGRVKVAYALTEKGDSIIPILVQMAEWGVHHQCMQVIVPSLERIPAEDLDRDGAGPGPVEFAEVDSLPGSEKGLSS